MLSSIRKFSKSWVAVILFMLLLVSLILWGGMEDMFKNATSTAVVRVGSREIPGPEFERRFNQQLEQIAQQQGGQPIPRDEALKAGVHERLLDQLAGQLSIGELIGRLGIKPAPSLIAAELQKIPQLFNEITGQFDKDRYKSLLAENGLTVESFERGLADEIAIQHFGSGLEAGMQAPRVYGALLAINQLENRSWSSFKVDPSDIAPVAKPTDAQLTAFMNENAETLRSPERRELSIIRFSSAAIEAAQKVDPAEVQKLYDFRKETMSKPEMRSIVQIPTKTLQQAQQAQARLAKGEDPAAVAKALGVDPIVYEGKPKTAITDRKVADAAFALPKGQVSAPIQGELGFAVVKVNEIMPGLTVGLEQARPQLEEQLKRDAAQKKVYETVEAYEKAREGGAGVVDAAKAVGATVIASGAVAQDGRLATGQIAPGASPRLIEQAFSMAAGEESDVEDEGNGEYYAMRIDRVVPAAMPSLDSVREPVTNAFIAREQRKALQAKADELAARVRKGESLEAVAATVGASVDHAVGVDRQAASQQVQALGQELLQGVFNGKKGDVIVTAAGGAPGFVVTRVDGVQTGALEQMAPVAEMSRQRIRSELLNDMFGQTQVSARAQLKPKVDLKRAAQALGVAAEDIAPPAKTAEKKAK